VARIGSRAGVRVGAGRVPSGTAAYRPPPRAEGGGRGGCRGTL